MSLYNHIEKMEPYFHSIRKHKGFFIIDIKLPDDWRYKDITFEKKDVVGFKDNGLKDGKRFLSFFSKQEEIDIENSVNTVLEVIESNKEREAKESLLREKMVELKKQFEQTDLDTLKSLEFVFDSTEEIETEIESHDEGSELVEQGTEEG
jgi:hypothetical protein